MHSDLLATTIHHCLSTYGSDVNWSCSFTLLSALICKDELISRSRVAHLHKHANGQNLCEEQISVEIERFCIYF